MESRPMCVKCNAVMTPENSKPEFFLCDKCFNSELEQDRNRLRVENGELESGLEKAQRDIETIQKSNGQLKDLLTRIISPEHNHGCRFCDSGRLRNPNKDHDADCAYKMAQSFIK